MVRRAARDEVTITIGASLALFIVMLVVGHLTLFVGWTLMGSGDWLTAGAWLTWGAAGLVSVRYLYRHRRP